MFPCNKFQCKYSNFQPANQGKCVRIYLTVILLCQTYLPPGKDAKTATRDDLTCKITYCSTGMLSLALSLSLSLLGQVFVTFLVSILVNPGGWAPATVLRAIYKKEYPKFLKRFTGYVIEQSKNKPIMY